MATSRQKVARGYAQEHRTVPASLRGLALAVVALVGATALGGRAEGRPAPPASKGAQELALCAKDPATWKKTRGGRGKLTFDAKSGAFTFVAHGLLPATDYALVRYADEPPKAHLLARGRSGPGGGLKLAGHWTEWTRKIWLVLDNDITGEPGPLGPESEAVFHDWNPRSYLFEEKLLGVPCDCEEGKAGTKSARQPKRQARQGGVR